MRSMVEGPLHRPSDGPPPLQKQGRIRPLCRPPGYLHRQSSAPVEFSATIVAPALRSAAQAPRPFSSVPLGAPSVLRSIEMKADTFRTVSTCFAAMFVSVLLVAASTSTALVA